VHKQAAAEPTQRLSPYRPWTAGKPHRHKLHNSNYAAILRHRCSNALTLHSLPHTGMHSVQHATVRMTHQIPASHMCCHNSILLEQLVTAELQQNLLPNKANRCCMHNCVALHHKKRDLPCCAETTTSAAVGQRGTLNNCPPSPCTSVPLSTGSPSYKTVVHMNAADVACDRQPQSCPAAVHKPVLLQSTGARGNASEWSVKHPEIVILGSCLAGQQNQQQSHAASSLRWRNF
jgi:hypothetical protein